MRLSWDDLDMQGCVEHGAPEWNTMTVVGPNKIRDGHGNATLQWTVTVHCAPVAPAPSVSVPETRAVAELEVIEPAPTVGASA